MDARITKTRLSNMLSYDWLKILLTIVASIMVLAIVFTVIEPRASADETFCVYAFSDLQAGSDSQTLETDLMERKVFSRDILLTQSEKFADSSGGGLFGGGMYAGAIYMTRLLNPERTVMFVNAVESAKSEGHDAVEALYDANAGESDRHGFLPFDTYLEDCERYLQNFYGEGLSGNLNKEKAKAAFLKRAEKKRQYRKEEKKAEGVEYEYAHLEKLKADYLAVMNAFETGLFEHAKLTLYEDSERTKPAFTINCGVRLGKLKSLRKLYYYSRETEEGFIATTEDISLILFNTEALGDRENGLRYETVSFLSYLITTYGE